MYYAMDCLAWNGMSLYDCTVGLYNPNSVDLYKLKSAPGFNQ